MTITILLLIAIVIIGYAVVDVVKNKKKKREYIQKIKSDIYCLGMLENCPNFVIVPDDYFLDMRNCLYRISNLDADDIIKDDILRSFMFNYQAVDNYKSKTWYKYIIVL